MDARDARFMAMAVSLAGRRVGETAPNPAVGAVIVKDGRVIGRGVTAPGGRPHAETRAIDQALARYGAQALAGATLYVTLEPCAHWGLTPPCANRIVACGIAKVVAATGDPDARVSGRGFEALRQGGVEVVSGVLEAEARRVNEGFLCRLERGRPFLTLKLALTLDGRIATAAGESRWITGGEARRLVHLMRARSDAVLIGSGTALADDPGLDPRDVQTPAPPPVALVADGRGRIDPGSRLVLAAGDRPVWLLHDGRAEAGALERLHEAGVETVAFPDLRDLSSVMAALARRGLTRILCEGGGQLAAALLDVGLVDRLVCFHAGLTLGEDARAGIGALGPGPLAAAPRLALKTLETVGPDVLSVWEPA